MKVKTILYPLLLAGWLAGPAGAAAADQVLKVCTAEDEMPYANRNGEGFENKLAVFVARELGMRLEQVFWSDPRYVVRDYLDKGQCDLMIGVDQGDPRLLTSEPYYRSGYVFISRTADGLALIDWNSEALRKAQRIAFVPGTPAETMMRAIGRYNDMFNYEQELVGFKSRRNQYVKYDNARLVGEVAAGRADIAVLWGPAAARYVKLSPPLTATLIPDDARRADGEKVPFHFSTAFGVRKDATALLVRLNKLVADRQQEINEILEAEGMPLLDEPAADATTH